MKTLIFKLSCVLVLSILLPVALLQAQVPRTFSYQGVLADGSGNFIPDGSHKLIINVYDQLNATQPVYADTQTVAVIRGIFNVIVGAKNPMPQSMQFDKAYYLGTSVDNGQELSPRAPISAVPYALRASVATVAEGLSPNATNAVQSVNGLSGAVTFKGTGSTTVTSSGSTVTINSTGGSGGTATDIVSGDGALNVSTSGSTTTLNVKNFGIRNAMLAVNSVTTDRLAPQAVTGDKIQDTTITAAKLASLSVTAAKMADNAVTESKIANNSISLAKMEANSVNSAKIVDGTIIGDDVSGAANLNVATLTTIGAVGVNTRAPASMLSVQGAGTTSGTSSLNIVDNVSKSLLYVRDDGNVGIGTATPGASLEIANAGIGLMVSNGSAVFSTASVLAGGVIPVPANKTVVEITSDGVVAANVLQIPPGLPGQILFITNNDQQATAGAFTVAPGQTHLYVFVSGLWRLIS